MGLRGVGGCTWHLLPKDDYRRAIPLVADTGLSKVAIKQMATIRADPVEKRSLAEVHAFQKYRIPPSTLASDVHALPVRCHALHCSSKSTTPRSSSNRAVASAAVRIGVSVFSAVASCHAHTKALNGRG